MKRYKASSLIKKSKHRDCFKHLGGPEKEAVLKRVEELIKEEKSFCDRGNFIHLSNILPSIAIYEVLQEYGRSEEEAFRIVKNDLFAAMMSTRKRFQRLSPMRWFWNIMPRILPLAFRIGSGKGWKFTWFAHKNKNSFCFEVNSCIYQKIFVKRKLQKFGPMFCHCDIIAYGSMPNIDFQRKGTLCYGDRKCDFKFVKHKTGEIFQRYPSR